jgi:2-iminobutanoate/2-iminopropanoate deaminase
MSENKRHQSVYADHLPKPAGPYSPATTLDNLIFVSGQGATDPRTAQLVGSDVESQTEQVVRNVESILNAAGSDLAHVLRCNVYLVDKVSSQR